MARTGVLSTILACGWCRSHWSRARDFSERLATGKDENEPYPSEDYPVFPPPPPRMILQNKLAYGQRVRRRRFGAPQGEYHDTSLYALYRLYECFVLDNRFGYRNFLEHFWRQSTWAISAIQDPADEDPERYALLASMTYLLVESFNAKIAIGLTRDMPALRSPEDSERSRNRPEDEKLYESVPKWAQAVPRLDAPLLIPTSDGTVITDETDARLDRQFLSRNIYIWKPHIHFT